jgi:putative ABC transport system permease protein
VPLLSGRVFTNDDRAGRPRVAIINETAAKRFWPNDNPLGKRLMMDPKEEKRFTVVGVVPDTRYRDLRIARPSIYFPLRQPYFPFAPTSLAIRTTGPSAELVPTLRRVIAETAPGVALASASPFETLLDEPLAQPRLNALLLVVFAGAALTLAAVGLFGIMMTMVRQRTRELGVRMALGATASDLREMILRRGLVIAGIGLTVGLLGSFATNRLLASLLYETSPTDSLTLVAVAVVLLLVALLASLIPARSSSRIDPMIALRSEG